MIDLHCHLLPGLDDGPATLEEAVSLALDSHGKGVTTAVATPHQNHSFHPTADEIRTAADALGAALADRGCNLELLTGAEIAIDRLGKLDPGELRQLTLGSGNCLLIESPFQDAPDHIEFMINDLMVDGFTVLLAHPERSGYFHSNPDVLRRLVARGVRCSLTAASFRGDFGRSVRRISEAMAREGLAANISSDAHDLGKRRPGLTTGSSAIEGLPGQEEMDALARELISPAA